MKKLLPIFIIFIVQLYVVPDTLNPIFAQEIATSTADLSLGIANYLVIVTPNVTPGDIITSTQEGFAKSAIAYDSSMIGVIVGNPAVALNFLNEPNAYPVMSTGKSYIKVSGEAVKAGDFITSSDKPGIGMKATAPGFAIGTALEGFTPTSADEVGAIAINLGVQYYSPGKPTVGNSLSDIFKLSAIAATESPSAVFKYVIAAIVVLTSFILGFLTFARTAAKGVDALGRNPMASRFIQFGIALNVVITIVIVAAGLGIAFLIIRL